MKKMQKIVLTWLLVFSMLIPFALLAKAAGETEVELDNNAISVQYANIAEYRTQGNLTAPERSGYLFAGWYTDEKCTTALSSTVVGDSANEVTAYAKFVPSQVLGVKAQATGGTDYNTKTAKLRLITTVDSLRYQKVGFEVNILGTAYNSETKSVYSRLYAMDRASVMTEYTPDIFDEASKYFMACEIPEVPNRFFGTGIKATPYWITLDGTKVSGASVVKTVHMSYMPYVAKMNTGLVNETIYPNTDVWNEYKGISDGVSVQGGCWDGEFYYQAIIHKCTDTRNPNYSIETGDGKKEYNDDLNEVIIQKYSLSNGSWNQEAQSQVLKLSHANDITYNANLSYTKDGDTKKGLLVVSHCGNYNSSKYWVSFVDRDDLTIIDPNHIDVTWGSGFEIENTHLVNDTLMTNICYNALRDKYVSNVSGTGKLQILNADFTKAGDEFGAAADAANYTSQGIECDDNYIYCAYSQSTGTNAENVIILYDWDGDYVRTIKLNVPGTEEFENIGIYRNTIYITAGNEGKTGFRWYKVTEYGDFVSESTKTEVFYLNQTASVDVYAETVIDVTAVKSEVYPYAGLRLEGWDTKNTIDFVVHFDNGGNQTLQSTALVEAKIKNAEDESVVTQYKYNISSAVKAVGNIKLGIAKTDGKVYFYVNDVLQGIRTFDGFGATQKVKVALYSKNTTCNFTNPYATTDSVDLAMTSKTDTFVAKPSRNNSSNFDLLAQEATDAKLVVNSNQWYSDIANWNKEAVADFRVETKVKINKVNSTSNGETGIVLSSGEEGNKYWVTLWCEEGSTISKLGCHSATANGSDKDTNMDKTWPKNGSNITKEDAVYKLAVERFGDTLKVYLDDVLVATKDLKSETYPITGNVSVGFFGSQVEAEFTDYKYELRTDVTENANYILDNTFSKDAYIETVVKTTEASTGSWSRAGLYLKNEAGEYVDFVLCYKKEAVPALADFLVEKGSTSHGTVDGTAQKYCIDSVKAELTTTGIKLAMAKRNGIIYVYANDVLLATREFEGFGKDDKVVGSLYSKKTTSYFTDYYGTSKNMEPQMEAATDLFVADTNHTIIPKVSFDMMNVASATDPKITINETADWAKGSIINWHEISANKFYAETKVNLTGTNASGAAVGIVLTSGTNRYNVMLRDGSNNDCTIDALTGVSWENGVSCAESTRRTFNQTGYSLSGTHKLAVLKQDTLLYVLLDDKVAYVEDLSQTTYPITGDVMVGLTAWKAQATFTDYNVKVGDVAPNVNSFDPIMLQKSITKSGKYEWKTSWDADANVIDLDVESTSAGTSSYELPLHSEAKADLYVETTLKATGTTTTAKKYPRVGIRFTSESGKTADFVVTLNATTTEGIPVYSNVWAVANGAGSTDNSYKYNTFMTNADLVTNGVKFGVARKGDTFYFYINDKFVGLSTFTDFAGDTKATASLFSNLCTAEFTDYSVKDTIIFTPDKDNKTAEIGTLTTAGTATATFKTSAVYSNVIPKVGFKLEGKNSNAYLSYYVQIKKQALTTDDRLTTWTLDKIYTLWDKTVAGTSTNYQGYFSSNMTKVQTAQNESLGVTLDVKRDGKMLTLSCLGIKVGEVDITTYGLQADEEVNVLIYSQGTESRFTDYVAK